MKWCLHCGEDFSSDGICWPCWGMPKPEPKNPKKSEPKNPEPKEPK